MEGFRVNPKTLMPEVSSGQTLDEQCATLDRRLVDMMTMANCPNCKHPLPQGWERHQQYMEVAKEEIMTVLLGSVRTRMGREATHLKVAILKGFDEYSKIPDRIKLRLKEYDEAKLQKLQEEHGEGDKQDGSTNNGEQGYEFSELSGE